jgi:diaminopimelate epimerase
MCGNGARSIVHFAQLLNRVDKTGTFLADDGPHQFVIDESGIQVEINVPGSMATWKLPKEGCGCINTGVPHLVVPEDNVFGIDLDPLGREMNDHPEHPEGINLNLISKGEDGVVLIRTWERGVNQETLACGTGATAAAIFVHQEWGYDWPIDLVFKGGTLRVSRIRNQYWLGGPVELVFKGQMSLDA